MGFLRRFFNKIIRRLLGHGPSHSADIAAKLDSATLGKVMEEAEFLRRSHAVSVKDIKPDEIPGLPRPVEHADH